MFIMHIYSIEQMFQTAERGFYIESQVDIMKTRRYKVVKPVRFFLFIMISIMIIVFAGYSLLNISQAQAASAYTYERVVVQDSDTLWGLAEMYNPDADVSYRDSVYDICSVNDISAEDIHPGDVLFIPVY